MAEDGAALPELKAASGLAARRSEANAFNELGAPACFNSSSEPTATSRGVLLLDRLLAVCTLREWPAQAKQASTRMTKVMYKKLKYGLLASAADVK
mmetsp:Transcript_42647/g.74920  ORF Transcript_42647/g.74920 Transcript_42647/m.74920 type:complete len:96 (+) Transcript_42647:474-761(+)